MPEERRLNQEKTKEVLSLMDRLSEIAGQPSFSSQVESFVKAAKEQRSSIKENSGLTDKETEQLINIIPDMLTETLLSTFTALGQSMEATIRDPAKMKEALDAATSK